MTGEPSGVEGQPKGVAGQPSGVAGQAQGVAGQAQGVAGQAQGVAGRPKDTKVRAEEPESASAPPGRLPTAAWPSYDPGDFYDELVGPEGHPRPAAAALWRHLAQLGPEALAERQAAADHEMRTIGVTFTVYEGSAGVDRPWPFDIIPRVMPADEWHTIEVGLVQRLNALNLFIDDVYHDQRCVTSGVVPSELVSGSPNFRRECVGIDPPGGIWAHICGSDLIRDAEGTVYVLEDNLRVPSGVSYLLENRIVAKHVFPELFRHYSIEPVDPYIGRLASLLASVSPSTGDPTLVVLTPGIYNSAYFEHAFLAQQLGVELVEGNDLVVLDDDCVYARTIDGLQRVDVIYRRIDDLFLDPEAFRPDSMLGVPGLMRAWRAGRVALVNAPGAGIADDKKVYAYVPDIIRFYLDEEPVLDTVPTLRCSDEDTRRFVLENLEQTGGQAGQRVGGLGRRGGNPGDRRPARGGGRPDQPCARPMGGPADHPPLDRPDAVRGDRGPAACGPPPLHPARARGRLRHPWRADPGGPTARLAGGQLVPRRR